MLFRSADVVKAVTSVDSWYTFDGNAIDAAWQDQEAINADGGVDGVNVPIAITYRTDENNPYARRS